MAQEDHAIDQFDRPYYSTASVSSTNTSSPLSASDSAFSSISSPSSLAPSPEAPGNVLLIVPGPTATINTSQPLDFAQVFGKLSATTPTATAILNSGIVNELLQTKAAITSIAAAAEQQRQGQVVEQHLLCDSKIIKIDQGIHSKNIKLSPEIRADVDCRSNDASSFCPTFSLKNEQLGGKIADISQTNNDCTPTPVPSSVSIAGDYDKLKHILIETSREALELEGSRHNTVLNGENLTTVTTTAASQVDPMVILSQAVNLQKVVNFNANFNTAFNCPN